MGDGANIPGWWSAGASWIELFGAFAFGVGGTFLAFVRRADKSDERIGKVEDALKSHVKDCSARAENVQKTMEAVSRSQTELQGQIYAVQAAQARQVTIDDMQKLSDSVVAALEMRRRQP